MFLKPTYGYLVAAGVLLMAVGLSLAYMANQALLDHRYDIGFLALTTAGYVLPTGGLTAVLGWKGLPQQGTWSPRFLMVVRIVAILALVIAAADIVDLIAYLMHR